MILSISIPILNAIYPVAIVLIILGLFDKYIKNNKIIYKLCIYSTAIISAIYAIDNLVNLGVITKVLTYIPLYENGFGWVIICVLMLLISLIYMFINKCMKDKKI